MTANYPTPVDGDVQAHQMPAMTDSERQKNIDAISTRMRSIYEEGDENLQFEYDILRFALVALTTPPAQLLRPVELPEETEIKWRDLALQFDGHRMQAISLLKMIINDAPDDQYLSVRNFLKSGPLPGEEVLRNRIAEIAEVQRLNATAQPVSDGWVTVARSLTAENGAKAALLGEFSVQQNITCHECFGEGCDDCGGQGNWTINVPVDWTTIKEIWAKGVENFSPAAPGGQDD